MDGLASSSARRPPNPLEPATQLDDSSNSDLLDKTVHPQQLPMTEDSAVTKAEKIERHGIANGVDESPSKRRKVLSENGNQGPTRSERQKGVAPIKKESVALMHTYNELAHTDQLSFAPGWEQRGQERCCCG